MWHDILALNWNLITLPKSLIAFIVVHWFTGLQQFSLSFINCCYVTWYATLSLQGPKDKVYNIGRGRPARLWLLSKTYRHTHTHHALHTDLVPTEQSDLMNEGQAATLFTSGPNQNQMLSAARLHCHPPPTKKLAKWSDPHSKGDCAKSIMNNTIRLTHMSHLRRRLRLGIVWEFRQPLSKQRGGFWCYSFAAFVWA